MTLKVFESIKQEMNKVEFEKWFFERAWFSVKIGGIIQPCIKLTRTKVGLCDGLIVTVGESNELKRIDDKLERDELLNNARILKRFDELSAYDQVALKQYINLLEQKTRLENEAKRKAGVPTDAIHCSFCGKSQHDAKKIIAGKDVYICDECVDICAEIMEEELNKE